MSVTQPTRWSEYYTPPLSAMGAIVLPYRFFVVKSAQQLGKPIPRIPILEGIVGGFRAAPTLGFTVGLQMVAQGVVEKWIRRGEGQPSFFEMFSSSALVGLISAPPLAAFNGLTMGRTIAQSIRGLSVRQTGAIVTRETSFLFALRINTPLGERMKLYFGENRTVEIVSAFMSGAIGSMIGHPADTALTLWQRGIAITSTGQLMRGGPAKAAAVGLFSIGYKLIGDVLK